jgi:hypothetical protein
LTSFELDEFLVFTGYGYTRIGQCLSDRVSDVLLEHAFATHGNYQSMGVIPV